MLSLPDKPWRRARLVPEGERRYRLTFVAGVPDRATFEEGVREDLDACLARGDRLTALDWESRSAVIETADVEAFVRTLALHRVMVERQP